MFIGMEGQAVEDDLEIPLIDLSVFLGDDEEEEADIPLIEFNPEPDVCLVEICGVICGTFVQRGSVYEGIC